MMDQPKRFPGCLIDLITGLFEMEIDNGNADAMNDLGSQYYDGNRGFEQSFEKAVRYYKMAAENGSRQAQENLGYCYYYMKKYCTKNIPVVLCKYNNEVGGLGDADRAKGEKLLCF